jgi:hypothetical protein
MRFKVILVALVLAAHLVVTDRVTQNWDPARWRTPKPARMQVSYVRELALHAPASVGAKAAPSTPTPQLTKATPIPPVLETGTTLASLRTDLPVRPKVVKKIKKPPEAQPVPSPALAPASAPAFFAPASAASSAVPASAAASGPADEPLAVLTAETADAALSASAPQMLPARPMWTESAPRHTSSSSSSSPSPAASDSSTASGFEWPAATRLSYKVTGIYRGEIHGQATVEWISSGPSAGKATTAQEQREQREQRYQVHMDVTVGLPFAPLFTRRMSSDGRLTPEGLSPERYDEQTKRLGSPAQSYVLQFDATGVILPNGQRYYTQANVQDPASQFVALAYRFAHHPEELQVGKVIELDLALPRQVSRRQFDVLAQEPVYTPFGALKAFHLKMRRQPLSKSGDFDPEVWLVPELRFLPARMRIEQGDENYLDMVLMKRPEVGAAAVLP